MFEVFLQFHDGCVVQYMRHADQSALYMADYLEKGSLCIIANVFGSYNNNKRFMTTGLEGEQ